MALGGPDTATRIKTVWQVRHWFAGASAQGSCLTAFPDFDAVIAAPTGRLTARTTQEQISTDPCLVPPGAGYRGLENQLYRVEVHQGGEGLDVTTAPAPVLVTRVTNKSNQVQFTTGTWRVDQAIEIVSTASSAHPMNGTLAFITAVDAGSKTLTLNINVSDLDLDELHVRPIASAYKWSRDNGSVVTAVENINDREVTVHDLGPDAVIGFNVGQWIEYSDDVRELNGNPGVLAQIVKIDRAINVITLNAAPPPLPVSGGVPDLSMHPKLRAWHGVGTIKLHPGAAPANDLELEHGIMVRFTGGTYRAGDYWTIPARTATANAQSGNIEWLIDASGSPLAQPPFGIRHHYCRLAMMHWDGANFDVIEDCRKLFPPLTELTALVYVSGDGQEAMPGSPLPQLLQTGVFNGRWPVAGAHVRFVAEGNGRVATTIAELPASTTNTITVTTGSDCVASCAWGLEADVAKRSQQVEARLLDAADNPTPALVRFNGNLSIADQVWYDAGTCQALQGRDTVQAALDQLSRLVSLYEVSGNNQEVLPGAVLEPLVVLAANRCGPVRDQKVRFKVAPGSGTLSALEASTEANGTATVTWTPDRTTLRQQVEATLVDDGARSIASPTSVRFTANLSVAGQVAYDPRACPNLAQAGVATVEQALNELCKQSGRPVLARASWIHGHSLHIENPEDITKASRTKSGILIEGRQDKTIWLHFAIPTPVIVNDIQLKVGSVMLRFKTFSDIAVVDSVHVYDGKDPIQEYDGLNLTGDHIEQVGLRPGERTPVFDRFPVRQHPVQWGLGISIKVKFVNPTDREFADPSEYIVTFISAGCDFGDTPPAVEIQRRLD